jgi:hypothetical protein
VAEERTLTEQYAFVEPMGHGAHFVARIESESVIPGATQFSVLRGDGSVDRTIWMSGAAIFRATAVSQENAIKLAQQLGQRQSIWNADPAQRLLLESENQRQEFKDPASAAEDAEIAEAMEASENDDEPEEGEHGINDGGDGF